MKGNYFPARVEQEAVAGFIVDNVIGDATGTAEGDRCIGEPPSARYYLSALAPRDVDLTAGTVRRGRVVPTSAGFEFEVEEGCVLGISARCSVYYRVFPKYQEQLMESDPDATPDERRDRRYRLVRVFKRRDILLTELQVEVEPTRPLVHVGEEQFAAEVAQIQAAIAEDPDAYRRDEAMVREVVVPGNVLANEEMFTQWLASIQGTVPIPAWGARITMSSRLVANGRRRVVALFDNRSVDPMRKVRTQRHHGENKEQNRRDDARDHFLFRVSLRAHALRARIVAMRMNLGRDAYRYDPLLPAYATNCGVDAAMDGEIVRELCMVPAPVHTTYRMPSTDHVATSFATLVSDPLPALSKLGDDLAAYAQHADWETGGLTPEQAEQKQSDLRAFQQEVARYRDGVQWLQRDKRLLDAFQLANETMLQLNRRGDREFMGWRLFQLVFIVSHMSALAWREHSPEE